LLAPSNAFLCQGNDVGTQYRSGIYYYTAEQEKLARESLAAKQKEWKDTIVTEILPRSTTSSTSRRAGSPPRRAAVIPSAATADAPPTPSQHRTP
jgi:hypothetical protein